MRIIRNEKMSGEWDFDGITCSRAACSFVKKKVTQWAARQRLVEIPKVRLQVRRLGVSHTMLCTVEVRVGKRLWTGSYCAPDLQTVISRSLEQMFEFVTPHHSDGPTGNQRIGMVPRPVAVRVR